MSLLRYILITLFAFLAPTVRAEEADSTTRSLPTDVYAYYVVVTPGNTFTTMLGHAAVRMQCPSAGLDYCFTVKSPEIGNEFTAMTLRTLHAGMVPEETEQFYQDYESEGRGISEYRLNLTIDEVRRLWKLLDDEVARGLYRRLDYIHHGCAQEMSDILFAAVQERGIDFGAIADELLPYVNRRQILSRYMDCSQWKGFVGHSLYGGSPDEDVNGTDKLIMPLDLAAALQKAQLTGEPAVCSVPTFDAGEKLFFDPSRVFMFFLMCCLLIPAMDKTFHYSLLILQFLIGLLITWMVFVSETPGTEWNWLIIAFNPIPLLIEKWARPLTYGLYTAVLWSLLLFMCYYHNERFFFEQELLITAMSVRTLYQAKIIVNVYIDRWKPLKKKEAPSQEEMSFK